MAYLSSERELELVRAVREQPPPYRDDAFLELYTSNEGILFKHAWQVIRARDLRIAAEELVIPWGQQGLYDGIRRFDATKGVQLMTYAVSWVRNSMHKGLIEMGLASKHSHDVRHRKLIGEATHELRQELEREPTPDEIAGWIRETKGLSYTARKVERYRTRRVISLEHEVSEGLTIGDLLEGDGSPERPFLRRELRQELPKIIREATRTAPLWVYEALCYRWGLSPHESAHTLQEAGDLVGRSRERVRQEEEKAFSRARRMLRH